MGKETGSFSGELVIANSKNLRQALGGKDNFVVRSPDLGQEEEDLVMTVSDSPAVLYFKKASFCTLMLAKDNRGDALGQHIGLGLIPNYDSSLRKTRRVMADFLQQAQNSLLGKWQLLLSGVNFRKDQQQVLIQAVDSAREQLKLNFQILPVFAKNNLWWGSNRITGLAYVPRQINTTKRDEVFLFEDNGQRALAEFESIVFC